eukprot:4185537-Lingulodinium_polyedra.AAC.1
MPSPLSRTKPRRRPQPRQRNGLLTRSRRTARKRIRPTGFHEARGTRHQRPRALPKGQRRAQG